MAKLTTAARNALPSSDFADPVHRAYPMEDQAHRKAANMLAPKFGSSTQQAEVKKKSKAFGKIGAK